MEALSLIDQCYMRDRRPLSETKDITMRFLSTRHAAILEEEHGSSTRTSPCVEKGVEYLLRNIVRLDQRKKGERRARRKGCKRAHYKTLWTDKAKSIVT